MDDNNIENISFSVTFGMTSTTMYYYTKVMSDLFLDTANTQNGGTFRTLTSVEDFWRVSLYECYPFSSDMKKNMHYKLCALLVHKLLSLCELPL